MPTEIELQRAQPASLYFPPLPSIDDMDPILWKEIHIVGRRARIEQALAPVNTARGVSYAFGALALLFIVAGLFQKLSDPYAVGVDIAGGLMLNGATVMIAVYLVPAALALSAIIARERRQGTLEPLLALPIERRNILRTKAYVVLKRGCGWIPVATLTVGIAFGLDRGWQQGLAASVFVFGITTLVAAVGTWLSVRCPTEVRALRLLLPLVVVGFGLPMGVWHLTARLPAHWPTIGFLVAAGLCVTLSVGASFAAIREFDRVL